MDLGPAYWAKWPFVKRNLGYSRIQMEGCEFGWKTLAWAAWKLYKRPATLCQDSMPRLYHHVTSWSRGFLSETSLAVEMAMLNNWLWSSCRPGLRSMVATLHKLDRSIGLWNARSVLSLRNSATSVKALVFLIWVILLDCRLVDATIQQFPPKRSNRCVIFRVIDLSQLLEPVTCLNYPLQGAAKRN